MIQITTVVGCASNGSGLSNDEHLIKLSVFLLLKNKNKTITPPPRRTPRALQPPTPPHAHIHSNHRRRLTPCPARPHAHALPDAAAAAPRVSRTEQNRAISGHQPLTTGDLHLLRPVERGCGGPKPSLHRNPGPPAARPPDLSCRH